MELVCGVIGGRDNVDPLCTVFEYFQIVLVAPGTEGTHLITADAACGTTV